MSKTKTIKFNLNSLVQAFFVALSDEEVDHLLRHRDDVVNKVSKHKHYNAILNERFGKEAIKEVWEEAEKRLAKDLVEFELEQQASK